MATQAHAVQRTAAASVHVTSSSTNVKVSILAKPVTHAEVHAARTQLRSFGHGGGGRFPHPGPRSEPRFPHQPHFPRRPAPLPIPFPIPVPVPVPAPSPFPLQTYHQCFPGEVLTNPVQVLDERGRAWCGDDYSYEYPDSTPYPYTAP